MKSFFIALLAFALSYAAMALFNKYSATPTVGETYLLNGKLAKLNYIPAATYVSGKFSGKVCQPLYGGKIKIEKNIFIFDYGEFLMYERKMSWSRWLSDYWGIVFQSSVVTYTSPPGVQEEDTFYNCKNGSHVVMATRKPYLFEFATRE